MSLTNHSSLRTPTRPKLSTCWRKGGRCVPRAVEGRQHSSRPDLSLPFILPINTGETRRKKREERGQERGKIEKKKKKQRRERKNRGERENKKTERKKRRKTTANHQCHHQRCCLLPPATLTTTAAKAGQPFSPSFSSPAPSRHPSLHFSRSMWTMESTVHTGQAKPNPRSWAGFGPAHVFRPSPAHLKKRIKRKKIQYLWFPHFFIYVFFCLISVCILCHKKYKSSIITRFLSKLPKYQKKLKKKMFFVYTINCLKANKSYCVFHTPNKNVLACILALITNLLKLREHWPKFQKQQKFYFVLF